MNLLLSYTVALTKGMNELKQENIELRTEIEEMKYYSALRISKLEEKLRDDIETVELEECSHVKRKELDEGKKSIKR